MSKANNRKAVSELTVLIVNPRAFNWKLVYDIEEMLRREGLPIIRHSFKRPHFSILIEAPNAIKRVRELLVGLELGGHGITGKGRHGVLDPKKVQICPDQRTARRELKLRFPDHG